MCTCCRRVMILDHLCNVAMSSDDGHMIGRLPLHIESGGISASKQQDTSAALLKLPLNVVGR